MQRGPDVAQYRPGHAGRTRPIISPTRGRKSSPPMKLSFLNPRPSFCLLTIPSQRFPFFTNTIVVILAKVEVVKKEKGCSFFSASMSLDFLNLVSGSFVEVSSVSYRSNWYHNNPWKLHQSLKELCHLWYVVMINFAFNFLIFIYFFLFFYIYIYKIK